MRDNDILILKGEEVLSTLDGKEQQLIQIVKQAYETHAEGNSSLPHSLFLRFPEQPGDRIIALPAYLGGEFKVAGMKWVSSFPGNIDRNLDRASAVVVLNSTTTGRPEGILEGSVISAKRTAASAALAAQVLSNGEPVIRAGVMGCGLINFEICRFLLAARPDVRGLLVYDLDPSRARQFKDKCLEVFKGIEVDTVEDVRDIFRNSSLISLATTASKPHIFDLSECIPGTSILHISLRDLSPELILAHLNVVDDADHVCRAETSIHLAEQLTGNRDFITGTLADVLKGRAGLKKAGRNITIFSPFGLGVLDIAVGKYVLELAREQNRGTRISSFLPESWLQRG